MWRKTQYRHVLSNLFQNAVEAARYPFGGNSSTSAMLTQTHFIGKSSISVGLFTYGFENVSVLEWDEGAKLHIGAFCSLATNITIFLGGNHRTEWVSTFPFGHAYQDVFGSKKAEGMPYSKGDVIIGNDVWISTNVTIMSGIKIGDGAVAAANSNIVKDVGPYEIVGGNPAKLLKQRFDAEVIELLLKLKWWELPVEVIREISPQLCSPPEKETLRHLIAKYRN